jgi:DNA-binding Xre family transcriptional regulator
MVGKMTKSQPILISLKQLLRAQGKTYADVAAYLQLSEASVKRLLSKGDLTLARLEKICQMLDMELTDFFRYQLSKTPLITYLTTEQEEVIVSDPLLLLIVLCVISEYTFDAILNEYRLTEHQCIQKLALLDKFKIIELLPNNRIKLRISPSFAWLPNGPIQRFFQKQLQAEFFQSSFSNAQELLICRTGIISQETNILLQKKMTQIAEEFNELLRADLKEPLHQRQGSALVLAIRPWNPAVLKQYKK